MASRNTVPSEAIPQANRLSIVRRLVPEPAPLVGPPVSAPWDEGLTEALLRAGRAVLEEHVLENLLAELCVG